MAREELIVASLAAAGVFNDFIDEDGAVEAVRDALAETACLRCEAADIVFRTLARGWADAATELLRASTKPRVTRAEHAALVGKLCGYREAALAVADALGDAALRRYVETGSED